MTFSGIAYAQAPAPVTSGTSLTTGTNSCPEKAGGRERGKHMEKLAEALGLTDQQKTQLRDLFKSHRSELKAIREDETLSKKEKHEKMKAVMLEIKQQAQSFLTPDQQQKWDQMVEQHQKKPANS